MRIAMVTETYPPEVNGVALTLESLARGLAVLGHRVTVIRPRHPGQAAEAVEGVSVVEVAGAPLPAYPDLRIGLPVKGRMRQLWRNDPPDAVYVGTEGPLGWAAARAARELGIPVTSGYHTHFESYAGHYRLGFAGGFIGRYLKRFHNATRATLVPTEELRHTLAGEGYRNVTVLRRAVDMDLFTPARRDPDLRRAWGVEDETPVAIFVGRIAPEKNLDLVVRAFEAFQRECPGSRMVWVGDGPSRRRLEREHPEHVFTGMLHGADLARHYASADVFFFPSLTETFGNVTLEALASGLAVAAYDYGAAHEFITQGTDGCLAPPGDEQRFIGWAVHLGRHPNARRRVSSNAPRSVGRLRPEAVAQRFAALLAGYSAAEGGK